VANVTFGSFQLDMRRGLVLQSGQPVQLRRKCFEALCVLAENPGSVVSREELMRRLWQDVTVGEDSLHKCMAELRKALQDREQKIIQTVPSRGYMLIAGSEVGLSDVRPFADLAAPGNGAPKDPGSSIAYAITAATVLLAVSLSVWYWYRDGQRHAIRSVAVLPFASPAGDAENAAIAEGLAESVAGNLSRQGKIRLAAFEASWRLSRRNSDIQKTGRALNVDAVVVGRVRPAGDQLRVGVELVRVADQTQIWGRNFVTDMAGLPALESEITDAISTQLDHSYANQSARRPQAATSTEAYLEFLKGRFQRRKRTPESNQAALGCFQRAVKIDPSFAPAWADLSEVQLATANFAAALPREARRLAREAATKALAIDNTLGEAHATMAAIQWLEDFAWDDAENHFRRALQLAPYSGTVHHSYSVMLLAMGRVPEALDAINLGQEADPFQAVLYAWKANVLFVSGSYREAVQESRKALALDATLAHLTLGRSQIELGQHREGLAELQTAREKLNNDWRVLGDLAYSYGVSGETDMARRLVEEMLRKRRQGYYPALPIALGYAGLGETSAAFEFLNYSIDERSTELWLKTDPRLHRLRTDPLYTALLAKMRLAGSGR
jgi:DNA-binding winged helix-turn-helix (wHTH) protein/TolB-like protein/Flp pilus assembly protein TadD